MCAYYVLYLQKNFSSYVHTYITFVYLFCHTSMYTLIFNDSRYNQTGIYETN